MSWLTTANDFLHAHWQAILWAAGLWIAVGNTIATKWPIPPRTAPWWVRALHFVVVNLPAIGTQLQGKTILGFTFSFPGIWTIRPLTDENRAKTLPGKGAIDLLVLMCIAASVFVAIIVMAGCAPTTAYVNAVKTKSTVSDTLVAAYAAWQEFDKAEHAEIIAKATTLAEGRAMLEAWKPTEKRVADAFVTARHAVETFSSALAAANAVKNKDFGGATVDVLTAVSELLSTLESAGVKIPSLPTVPGQSPTDETPKTAREQLVASVETFELQLLQEVAHGSP